MVAPEPRPDLALDPSCWRTGYGVLRPDGSLREAGLFSPKRSATRGSPFAAAAAQTVDLDDLLREFRPENLVIELPSPHVFSRHGGGGKGLTVYGFAVGLLVGPCLRAAELQRVGCLIGVAPENWTGGRKKTESRAEVLATFPSVAATLLAKDGGGDISDAIALGLWFQREGRQAVLKSRFAHQVLERFWVISAPRRRRTRTGRCTDAGTIAQIG